MLQLPPTEDQSHISHTFLSTFYGRNLIHERLFLTVFSAIGLAVAQTHTPTQSPVFTPGCFTLSDKTKSLNKGGTHGYPNSLVPIRKFYITWDFRIRHSPLPLAHFDGKIETPFDSQCLDSSLVPAGGNVHPRDSQRSSARWQRKKTVQGGSKKGPPSVWSKGLCSIWRTWVVVISFDFIDITLDGIRSSKSHGGVVVQNPYGWLLRSLLRGG